MWFRYAVGEPFGCFVRNTQSCIDLTNLESYSHHALKVPITIGSFEERNILVWRLPIHISQSRLAGRQVSSNACTIISLKVIEYLCENNVLFPSVELEDQNSSYFSRFACFRKAISTAEFPCPGRLTSSMANAILEGNEIHERVVFQRSTGRKNFTIPEALDAVRNSFREMDFCSVRGSLRHDLPDFLLSAIDCEILSSYDCLYFMLIVVEQCVVIVYQRAGKLIGFLDSHLHSPDGAIVACTTLANLNGFCLWLENHIFIEANVLAPSLQSFELSSICRLDEVFAKSATTPSSVLRRHSVFPAPEPWQILPQEVRGRAHQIILEQRRRRLPPLPHPDHKTRLKRGARYSASLPLLL